MTASTVVLPAYNLNLVADRWTASGEPRGVVLLLHGGGQTRHSWAHTAQRVARAGWNVYALDTRGHGDSDWASDGDYSTAALAADLMPLLQETGPAALCGASLGGITALRLAATQPHLVRALVLVDIAPRVEPGAERVKAFMQSAPDGFSSLREAADAIHAYNPGRARPASLEGLKKNLRRRQDGRWRWHWDPKILQQPDAVERERSDFQTLAAEARAVLAPTLLIRGGRSDVLSEAGAEELQTLIPHAEIGHVATAAHMVAGDDNDGFGYILEGFLSRLVNESIDD
jgi:pimeloyl-ACP methyl ester carboxylesterase